MFVHTEATPNPATMKFMPGCEVMASGTAEFVGAGEAARSPLALRLFAVEGVRRVLLGPDFISVTRSGAGWERLETAVTGAIIAHFTSGEPVVAAAAEAAGADEDEDDTVAYIKELLETRVRPAVAQDGGDITFHGYEDGVVWVHMQGACAGCPLSAATLQQGIESMLRHYIPEIMEVRAI